MNSKKIVFSVVFILLFTLILPFSAVAEGDIWDGSSDNGFESGSGTQADPYIIKTASQLAFLSKSVSGGESYKDRYIKLDGDILLNEVSDILWTEGAKEWLPVGNPITPFEGFFDGGEHKIIGVYISSGSDSQGLFGVIGENGTVISLTVSNSSISGNNASGGIAGTSNGTIAYCRNNDAVRGATNAGGIVGINNGTVSSCANYGWVGNGGNDGGIAGLNCGTIENCYNNGTVDGGYSAAGGITAENRGTVSKCYNAGFIISEYGLAGGIVCNNSGTVTECYYLDFGTHTDKLGAKLSQDEMQNKDTFIGFDFEKVWTFDGESDYLYPTLRKYSPESQPPQSGNQSGEVSSPDEASSVTSEEEPPVPKKSYALWVLLAVLVVLVAIKAIIWYIQKRK